jgi:hypothetical protein
MPLHFFPYNVVMRKDGTVFSAGELSQAACEQLYAAIRFALASETSNSRCSRCLSKWTKLSSSKNGSDTADSLSDARAVSRSFQSGQVMRLLS